MPDFYALAPGHDNTAGYIAVTDLLSVHVSGAGSFEVGIEREYLDGSVEDTGTAEFDWELSAGMLPEDVANIETNILNGQRTGPATVSTKLNNGTWVDVNVTLRLPRVFTRQGVRYAAPTLRFTNGEVIP